MKYCEYIIERAKALKDDDIIRQVGNVLNNYKDLKDKKLREVVIHSCGFHHAGMVRTDRNAV